MVRLTHLEKSLWVAYLNDFKKMADGRLQCGYWHHFPVWGRRTRGKSVYSMKYLPKLHRSEHNVIDRHEQDYCCYY
jgi:hypothetical protein